MRLNDLHKCSVLKIVQVAWLALLFQMPNGAMAQECEEMPTFSLSGESTIDWQQFPDFDLPFTLIYGANAQNGDFQNPLNHGFTHITDANYFKDVAVENRALIYYGSAYANANQPWETLRSPWNNDLALYEQKWESDYKNLASTGSNPNLIDTDILSFDIERVWRFDHEILRLKNESTIPAAFKTLSDADFLTQYKTDMRALYSRSVQSILEKGIGGDTKITSYADSPIVNTFDNIQGKSWADWQSEKSVLNFITDNSGGNVGGDFYNQMNFIGPSTYYYYDYPHPFAGEYLSYLLFQIEANRAWTNKPVIPFVWLRYSFNTDIQGNYIKPWMAEATAIFPFFSGADGLWLWENPLTFKEETNFDTYSYFIKGLYRLSQFKDMFEGDHELVIETSARDYNENKQPIWRGVVKNQEIVIAAHNPFAKDENEEVIIGVAYENWSSTVTLKGYEVKLCKYDMTILSSDQEPGNNITVFPNPSSEQIRVRFNAKQKGTAVIRFVVPSGQVLGEMEKPVGIGNNDFDIDISKFSTSQIILQVRVDNQVFTKKIFKSE